MEVILLSYQSSNKCAIYNEYNYSTKLFVLLSGWESIGISEYAEMN